MHLARCVFVLGLLFLLPAPVLPWSRDGHVIVSKTAETFFSPEARAAVKDLLDGRPISDDRLCTWADLIRSSAAYKRKYPNHNTWHYIDIDVSAQEVEFKPADDNNHVVGAIERFKKVLKDTKVEKEDRKEALLFLVHFLGDMHQPLHCTDRDNDRGGNRQLVKSFNGKEGQTLNLHSVWDSHMVDAARGELTVDDFVKRLTEEIMEEDRKSWEKGDAKQWAWESHTICVERVYKFTDGTSLPKRDAEPVELTEVNYIKANLSIVPAQLKKGGVRLAKVLNECFEGVR
jgi:hypothetical protein